jgi:hypothetical protein
MGYAAIGGLVLLVVLAIWFLVSEAKSGATSKEAAKAMKEVIDAGKRFEKARRESAGLPRRERLYLMLQELRARPRPKVP